MTTAAPTARTTTRPPLRLTLGLPWPVLAVLVALAAPRVVVHDLALVAPDSSLAGVLALVPLAVWGAGRGAVVTPPGGVAARRRGGLRHGAGGGAQPRVGDGLGGRPAAAGRQPRGRLVAGHRGDPAARRDRARQPGHRTRRRCRHRGAGL